MFLLTVIPARSRAFSAVAPESPMAVTSASIRWLSVPPLASLIPPASKVSASGTGAAKRPATPSTANPSATDPPAPPCASGTQASVSPASATALEAFLNLFPCECVVAVGRLAKSQLDGLSAPVECVRHPASGGAAIFRKQIGTIARRL